MNELPGSEAAGRDDQQSFGGLLSQARCGSSAALGELLEGFREFLLLTAEATLDSDLRPKVGASDLVQESLIEAQQGFDDFQGGSENEFRGWLKRILINNLLNQYRAWKKSRKRQLSREMSLAGTDSQNHQLVDPAALPPSALASQREQEQVLRQAIDRLSDDHRQAIVLRHREQLPFEEIGRRMNRSADAARMLWYRAFERLAIQMGRTE